MSIGDIVKVINLTAKHQQSSSLPWGEKYTWYLNKTGEIIYKNLETFIVRFKDDKELPFGDTELEVVERKRKEVH